MGLPVRAPRATNRKNVPLLVPISRIGEIWAIREGPRETKAPELKPYRMQKMMMGALAADGSHRAKTIMDENAVVMIMTLKRPTLSATIPGKILPKILPPW